MTTKFSAQVLDQAHRASVTTQYPEMADELIRVYGSTMVVYMTGTKGRQSAHLWKTGAAEPRHRTLLRLQLAYTVHKALTATETAETARNWFLSHNPDLPGYVAPKQLIREMQTGILLDSLHNFISSSRANPEHPEHEAAV